MRAPQPTTPDPTIYTTTPVCETCMDTGEVIELEEWGNYCIEHADREVEVPCDDCPRCARCGTLVAEMIGPHGMGHPVHDHMGVCFCGSDDCLSRWIGDYQAAPAVDDPHAERALRVALRIVQSYLDHGLPGEDAPARDPWLNDDMRRVLQQAVSRWGQQCSRAIATETKRQQALGEKREQRRAACSEHARPLGVRDIEEGK